MPPVISNSGRLTLLRNKPAGQLLIHEIYRSLQGESAYQGLPCVFVRLSVCDSRCVWCDTPHAFNQGELRGLDEIVAQVVALGDELVEITGGEPLLQEEVHDLMTRLADLGKKVLLETSGAHPLDRVDSRVHIIMDLKCPDSGEEPGNHWPNLQVLKPTDEIKFVLASRLDFDWAVNAIRRHDLARKFSVLMSAVFNRLALLDLANWILESRLPVRMQLQMHKFVWEPDQRGV
ncbi:7-carboxy-7-deazaguanine synthase QueE [soil metagenome]